MYYMGSKLKLLEYIEKSIREFTGIENFEDKIFCDLFAGTGSVASHFKTLNCKIIANDIQTYSYIINRNLIENNKIFSDELIEKLNNIEPVKGFIFEHYCPSGKDGRIYFSDENGMKCDAIRQKIGEMYNKGEINDGEYVFLISSLIDAIDRVANTTSVYGAYLKKLKKSALVPLVLTPVQPVLGKHSGKVYNRNGQELIKEISGDILFLDPPYNSRGYDSNYHCLETIARYDNPQLKGKTGIRDEKITKSEFCSKVKALSALEQVIKDADFKYVFLTYSTDGIMKAEDIENIFKKYGRTKVYRKLYKRYRADKDGENRNYKKNDLYECIFCLEKTC